MFKDRKKADLHVHLNGLVSTEVFKQLLRPYNTNLPNWFDIDNDLVLKGPVNSLPEYLRPWYGFKLVPQTRDELKLMINSAVANLASDNVCYAEIRNSPFNIADLCNAKLEVVLNWLCDMVEDANERFNVQSKLVISLSRYKLTFEKAKLMVDAVKNANRPDIIVGLDLSGNEDEAIDQRIAGLFRGAKETLGTGITIHAGETGNLENIKWAINECAADRIGHACALCQSVELIDTIIKRDVCIECCLSSNILSGVTEGIEHHHVKLLMEYGVPFVLCSDNPIVHNRTLSDEYDLFHKCLNSAKYLDTMFSNQMKYSFGGKH